MATTETRTVRTDSQTQTSRQRRGAGIILAIFAFLFLLGMGAARRTNVPTHSLAVSVPAPQATRAISQVHTPRAHKAARGANTSPGARARVVERYGKLPMSFEANHGQTARQVKFLSRGAGYTVFLTKNEAVLALNNSLPGDHRVGMGHPSLPIGSDPSGPMTLLRGPATLDAGSAPGPITEGKAKAAGAVVRMRLVNASPAARIAGAGELPGKSNYLIGKNPKNWRTNVPTYAKVKYQDVYPGVDLVYYGNQRQLEYDFMVAPGADPGTIRLGVHARISKVEIAKNGDLVVRLGNDEVRFRKPVVYQPAALARERRNSPGALHSSLVARHFLAGRFVLLPNNEVGFQVASYDHTKPLIIDPTLVYSTYLGGSGGGRDYAAGIAVDSTGAAYVTGATNSADFPTTAGAYQSTFVSGTCHNVVIVPNQPVSIVTNFTCSDVFVTKLNASGTALVYSTYIGGTGSDAGNGIAVDSSGAAYVTGTTGSTDFPTVNPIQATGAMGGNAFVAKLNAAGNGLVYSTYLSGSVGASGAAIAVDSAGSAYVTGQTSSMDFPTANPIQGTLGGAGDAFVVKLNAAGTALVYGTYLGGSRNDVGNGIAVDSAGNAYVTGLTVSTDFPTVNAFQAAFNGGSDAFVAKLNPAGSAFVYSTYLGGSSGDEGYAIAADSAGSAYVTGYTNSTDFPTVNAFQAAFNGGSDAFVAKLNPAGSALVYSTYLGGSKSESADAIAVDAGGSAYVAGGTSSTDFPTVNAIQAASGGGLSDAFITKLNAAGNALDFSTYLGGTGGEGADSFSLDSSGNAYVAGIAGGGVFPTTSGALQSQGPSTANCVNWPSGYVPFTQLTSFPAGLVVGYMSLASYQQMLTIPLPAFAGEGFCTPAELAPGVYYTAAADPSAPERNGDFIGYGPIIDPTTGQPVPGNIIPPASIGSFFAWSLNGLPPPSDPFVAKISGFPTFTTTVTLNPSSVNFGSAVVSSSTSAQTVTLTNSGSGPLTISSISITGADSADFSQSNTCGNSLAASSNCTISVTFTPTAGGSRRAMLTISDNAASSPQMTALSGTGQDFALAARTTSLTAVAGATASFDLVISPQGGFNQSVDLSCSGAPAHSTCTVTPASITLNGASTVSFKLAVSTTGSALAPPGGPGNFGPPAGPLPMAAWLAIFSLLGLAVMGSLIPRGSRVKRLAPFAALALLVTLWAACGAGKSSSSSGPTPAGSYSVTVTATAGSLTHTSKVTLNVQ